MFFTRPGTHLPTDGAPEEPNVRIQPATKPVAAFLKFLTIAIPSALGGNFAGDYMQNRGWEYQHTIESAEADARAAETALQNLNDQLDSRWLSIDRLYRVAGKVEEKVDGQSRDDVVARFYEVDAKWDKARNGLLATLQFDVDAPFGVDGADPAAAVAKLDCSVDPLADAESISEKPSARLLFQIADHCMMTLKNDVDAVIEENEKTGAWKGFDPQHRRLDYVFRVNNVLRCVVAERALAIRMDYSPPALFWALVAGGSKKPYAFPSARAGECGLPDHVDRQPAVASLTP